MLSTLLRKNKNNNFSVKWVEKGEENILWTKRPQNSSRGLLKPVFHPVFVLQAVSAMEKREGDSHTVDQNAFQNIIPRRNRENLSDLVMFL